MPIRYIAAPSQSIALRDPITKELIKTAEGKPEEEVTFELFLGRLMHNPLWGSTWGAFKAQAAIFKAWEKAKIEREIGRVLVLSEEDWEFLKATVEKPMPVGFAYHPALLSQLMPFAAAVMDATATDPKSALLTPPEPPKPE